MQLNAVQNWLHLMIASTASTLPSPDRHAASVQMKAQQLAGLIERMKAEG
jgi:hypothetical protein